MARTAVLGSRRRVSVSLRSGEDCEEVADLLLAGERIGQRQVGLDGVVVAAPVAPARDVAGVGELDDDPVRGAFGDPDRLADLPQADARVMRDAQQYLGVVGEKRPAGRWSATHDSRL